MSRAFTKETEGGEAFEDLPDRPLSPHPNFVTPQGLEQIEAELVRLQDARAAAQSANDSAALANATRDLRYWTARRASAQVIEPPENIDEVHFGSTVVLHRNDGKTLTYRIVGEDEADPVKGTISYVSPLAKALMQKQVGDVAQTGNAEVEIVAIK
ncbi:transcription elongation factor GreA [Microvirga flavescens]|uniref:transcription elongation factor GreA n=1 Tax=Microvirga flavescens TaxID=2249811 RepID=UPI000DD511A4|nr:transcription elongation factor GreA [Microvirga flavescens]